MKLKTRMAMEGVMRNKSIGHKPMAGSRRWRVCTAATAALLLLGGCSAGGEESPGRENVTSPRIKDACGELFSGVSVGQAVLDRRVHVNDSASEDVVANKLGSDVDENVAHVDLCDLSGAKEDNQLLELTFSWARDYFTHAERVVYRPSRDMGVSGKLYFNCDLRSGDSVTDPEVVAALLDRIPLDPEARKDLLFSAAKSVAAELDCKTSPDFSKAHIDYPEVEEDPTPPQREPEESSDLVPR